MVPNILSMMRMALSLSMLAIEPATILFYVVYLCCGLTDVADGFLARRLHAVTKTGKALDVIGDAVFMAAVLVLLFGNFEVPFWLIIWVAGTAVLRIAAYLIAFVRVKTVFTHTYLDRVAGVSLFFLLPSLFLFADQFMFLCVGVCVLTMIATIDMLFISLLMKEARSDVYSVFQVKQANGS